MPQMSLANSGMSADGEVNASFPSNLSAVGRGRGAVLDMQSIAVASVAAMEEEGGLAGVGNAATGHDGREPLLHLIKRFIFTGMPLSLAVIAQFSLNTVIMSVHGKLLGVEELGGTSLALGLINATGFAFGSGLCGALETVLSHTYGRFKNAPVITTVEEVGTQGASAPRVDPPLFMYGTYTQRMSIILLIIAFPLGAILCFMDAFLSSLGESAFVLYFTGVFCRTAMFGIPATLAFQLMQRYYSCQHITRPFSAVLILAACINPILQLSGVKMFGFVGSPIAWVLLMYGIVAALIIYMRYTGIYRKTWGGWNEKSYQNMPTLVGIAIPSMGVMLSEWVALEVNALAASFAPEKELAAFFITLQLFGVMWGVASGIMSISCVFVGNAIGADKPLVARRIAVVAVGIVASISLFDILLVYLLEDYIPYIFTNDYEVTQIYSSLMRIVLPYHIFNTFQSTVMGILRGCGMQKVGAIVITIAFTVIGVPLSFLLFFHYKIGVQALWIGPFTGVALFGCPTYLYVLFRYIDWENLKPHEEDAPHVDAYPNSVPRSADAPPPMPTDHSSKLNSSSTGENALDRTALVRQYLETLEGVSVGSPHDGSLSPKDAKVGS